MKHENTQESKFKEEIMSQLADVDLEDVDKSVLQKDIQRAINVLSRERRYLMTEEQKHKLSDAIYDDIFGFGVLQDFIEDESITDILINGCRDVYFEQGGMLQRFDETLFNNENELRRYAQRLVAKVNKRIDEVVPYCDARIDGVGRVNVIIPPIGLDGTLISIRKFKKSTFGLEDLANFGAFTPQMCMLFDLFAKSRANIIISGGTGSGKTTLLNAVSQSIPSQYRIITIEDTAELNLKQDHVVRMESRPPSIEGTGEVSIRKLLVNALRMRPDLIVVGECRSGEAYDMVQAMNTGHDGSMSTLHSNNSRDAINRIVAMSMMAQGNNFPVRYIQRQVIESINVIIHVSRMRDGKRRVTEVSNLIGLEGDTPVINNIFRYNHTLDRYDIDLISQNSQLYQKIINSGFESELHGVFRGVT
ncbi:CpaF family protein [Fangia hongkongensis]|uniref:CpaF family protein n=1 Tax=Fangia hongkongensis TaxID=270495 RepID=UPI000361279F|nr:CpaF family protein [Fangia hongkongensis]MBK2124664.1 CpaF family protein [Fangia hongkongensis]